MPEALRAMLQLLVLANLGFVQVTEAVATELLLPLWLLAGTAPLLRRLQRHRLHAIAWNGGVVLAFGLLVHHASTTGLLHMLEDGLLLAALCQVHLLNNLGQRQRPDLLFFNSFLIAFVTSFFSPHLGWSIVFFCYAALLLPTLQLFQATRGGVALPPDGFARILRDSVPKTAGTLLLTGIVFVVWPRDFHRDGWLEDTLDFALGQQAGLAEEIRFDRTGPLQLSDREVLRIRPADGNPDSVPTHWRCITFSRFDGVAWKPVAEQVPAGRDPTDEPWLRTARDHWIRAIGPEQETIRVQVRDDADHRLPLPLAACRLREAPDLELAAMADATLTATALDERDLLAEPILCEVGLTTAPRSLPLSALARARLCQQPVTLPPILRTLARELRAQLPAGAGDRRLAEHFRDWLQAERRYHLPGEAGAARNLGEFLLGTGGGHCEYFATALVLLLRLHRVPCRVVGGYAAHEWDQATREVVVRRLHAHAWAEVWLDGEGFVTFDATPPTALEHLADADGWWGSFTKTLRTAWASVTSFDGNSRDALFAWLGALPRRLAATAHAWLPPLFAAVLLVLLLRWLRRRAQGPRSVRELRAARRKNGLEPRPGETPRELLARAQEVPGAAGPVELLSRATALHERDRYGSAEPGR
jgi:hypothetical protein